LTTRAPDSAIPPAPSVVLGVLARLLGADRQRAIERRRQLRERLGAIALVALLSVACLGPQTSDLATRTFAWLLAAAAAWRVLVTILLGGLVLVPVASAACLLAVSFVVWQRLIELERRGARS
jgi:hypothetical protein